MPSCGPPTSRVSRRICNRSRLRTVVQCSCFRVVATDISRRTRSRSTHAGSTRSASRRTSSSAGAATLAIAIRRGCAMPRRRSCGPVRRMTFRSTSTASVSSVRRRAAISPRPSRRWIRACPSLRARRGRTCVRTSSSSAVRLSACATDSRIRVRVATCLATHRMGAVRPIVDRVAGRGALSAGLRLARAARLRARGPRHRARHAGADGTHHARTACVDAGRCGLADAATRRATRDRGSTGEEGGADRCADVAGSRGSGQRRPAAHRGLPAETDRPYASGARSGSRWIAVAEARSLPHVQDRSRCAAGRPCGTDGRYAAAFARQERSGLNVTEFARHLGVSGATLYQWRRDWCRRVRG